MITTIKEYNIGDSVVHGNKVLAIIDDSNIDKICGDIENLHDRKFVRDIFDSWKLYGDPSIKQYLVGKDGNVPMPFTGLTITGLIRDFPNT